MFICCGITHFISQQNCIRYCCPEGPVQLCDIQVCLRDITTVFMFRTLVLTLSRLQSFKKKKQSRVLAKCYWGSFSKPPPSLLCWNYSHVPLCVPLARAQTPKECCIHRHSAKHSAKSDMKPPKSPQSCTAHFLVHSVCHRPVKCEEKGKLLRHL